MKIGLCHIKQKITTRLSPEKALSNGSWVKLICGASNQDLVAISDICAVFAAAGVHCVDVAADIAVVNAARKGLNWVEERQGIRPWLMVSVSDGKDLHFRKAKFDPKSCPIDCPRPCEKICPANAIYQPQGINKSRCYGCGRCLPICPKGLISEEEYKIKLEDITLLLSEVSPDAVEIHTGPGRKEEFKFTVKALLKSQIALKRIAVSCGLKGSGIDAEKLADELWLRHACLRKHAQKPIWQLDGRPMSGDIGSGTAHFAVNLWETIRPFAPPGPLQLAGGTNFQTIKQIPINQGPAGVAFGGIARKLLQPLLLEAEARSMSLREWPEGWQKALIQAKKLVDPWLSRNI